MSATNPAADAAKQLTLDELTKGVTACGSWYDFSEAMTSGYTPTLVAHSLVGLRGKRREQQMAWNACVEELANRLEKLGYKVWRGLNTKKS